MLGDTYRRGTRGTGEDPRRGGQQSPPRDAVPAEARGADGDSDSDGDGNGNCNEQRNAGRWGGVGETTSRGGSTSDAPQLLLGCPSKHARRKNFTCVGDAASGSGHLLGDHEVASMGAPSWFGRVAVSGSDGMRKGGRGAGTRPYVPALVLPTEPAEDKEARNPLPFPSPPLSGTGLARWYGGCAPWPTAPHPSPPPSPTVCATLFRCGTWQPARAPTAVLPRKGGKGIKHQTRPHDYWPCDGLLSGRLVIQASPHPRDGSTGCQLVVRRQDRSGSVHQATRARIGCNPRD